MNKPYTILSAIFCLSIFTASACLAQTTTLALKTPAKEITIDGLSTDWGDSLSYYNTAKKVRYSISNDKTNLYLVVKTNDLEQENDITVGGLTFTIDPKGKKKYSFSTTYPAPAGGMLLGPNESLDRKRRRADITAKVKRITVSGFKDISDDNLSSVNDYNIKIALNYDDDGSLVYEEAIPLELFHASELAKGEWSFNIKMNGIDGSSIMVLPASASPQTSGVTGATGGTGTTTRVVTVTRIAVPAGTFPSTAGSGNLRSNPPSQLGMPVGVGRDFVKSTLPIDFWGKFTLVQ